MKAGGMNNKHLLTRKHKILSAETQNKIPKNSEWETTECKTRIRQTLREGSELTDAT